MCLDFNSVDELELVEKWVENNFEDKKLIINKKKSAKRRLVKIWMGGLSIMSGSLSGAQGAFPARQILILL